MCSEAQFRPELALTRLELAELTLDQGSVEATHASPRQIRDRAAHAEALGHLDVAIAGFRDMGMQPALERALRCREAVAGRVPNNAAGYPDGLSQREVQVLRLIATERNNREIAAELAISVRTLEHHIAHLYAKIGARGRVDATAYALRHELA